MGDAELADQLTAFFGEAFREHAAAAREAYALGLYLYHEDEIGRTPVIAAGFNTEAGIEEVLSRRGRFRNERPVPEDADEARWDFAFWSHTDLARFGDPALDPEGAATLEAWIRHRGLWYDEHPHDDDVSDDRFEQILDVDEEIDEGLIAVLADVAERLQRDVVPALVAGPVPVLIHEPDYYPELAAASRSANPPGLADAFVAWVGRARAAPTPASPEAPESAAAAGKQQARWMFAGCLLFIAIAAWSALRAITHEGPPNPHRTIEDGIYILVPATVLFAGFATEHLRVARGGDPDDHNRWVRFMRTRAGTAAIIGLVAIVVGFSAWNPLGV